MCGLKFFGSDILRPQHGLNFFSFPPYLRARTYVYGRRCVASTFLVLTFCVRNTASPFLIPPDLRARHFPRQIRAGAAPHKIWISLLPLIFKITV